MSISGLSIVMAFILGGQMIMKVIPEEVGSVCDDFLYRPCGPC